MLKTWFRMTGQGQEFNIFVIIECEEKSVGEVSYDKSAHRLLTIKEEREEAKPIIKKETKGKKEKKAAIKKKKSRSPVRRVLENETLNSHWMRRTWIRIYLRTVSSEVKFN